MGYADGGIEKVGAAIVRDGRVLLVRKTGQPSPEFFMAGGKVEPGETWLAALVREVREELGVDVVGAEFLGSFRDVAVFEAVPIVIHAYQVRIAGEPSPSGEITEIRWLDSREAATVSISSIMARDVIPRLAEIGVLDWDGGDPGVAGRHVVDLLGGPFEWCHVPGGTAIVGEFGAADVPSFWMAKYPVTVGQFDVFLNAADGYVNDQWWEGLAHRDTRPVDQSEMDTRLPRVQVSWYESVAFCRWLGARLTACVRLPTDWEWQLAASGGADRVYPWGDQFRSGWCNTKESGLAGPTPVDLFPDGASAFGVLDMSGNVWERCVGAYAAPALGSLAGAYTRTIRGGSWRYSRAEAAVRHRQVCIAERRFDDGGFRVILSDDR